MTYLVGGKLNIASCSCTSDILNFKFNINLKQK